MKMFFCYFKFYDFESVLFADLRNQLFRSFPHLLPLKYFLQVLRTPHKMIARVIDRMTRSFYRHTFFISHFFARAYAVKGDFPVPLTNPLGEACIHPARQAAGDSAKVSLKQLFSSSHSPFAFRSMSLRSIQYYYLADLMNYLKSKYIWENVKAPLTGQL